MSESGRHGGLKNGNPTQADHRLAKFSGCAAGHSHCIIAQGHLTVLLAGVCRPARLGGPGFLDGKKLSASADTAFLGRRACRIGISFTPKKRPRPVLSGLSGGSACVYLQLHPGVPIGYVYGHRPSYGSVDLERLAEKDSWRRSPSFLYSRKMSVKHKS